jgi:protein O-GlcNAc transferase
LPEAETCVRQLLADEPQYADAWVLLGTIQQARGRIDEALVAFHRSLALAPDTGKHSKLLTGLQYADTASPDQLLDAHRQWDAAYARHLLPKEPVVAFPRPAAQSLRLGFISGDFGHHPTGFLVLPALECLDKSRCSVVCYFDRLMEDEFTARFRAAADIWRPISGLSDDDLTDQIRKDEIDILVDLTGHVGHRLLVFARKPAPVQITWFGYVGTTGLTAIDFLLADRFHVRSGEDAWYTESVLRLPNGYACYRPPNETPAVGPLPALASGRVTFGCFNNPAKYSYRILDAWAQILRRSPTAQLLLKFGWLGDFDVQQSLREQFAQRGVEPERILVEGPSPHRELLASYNRVDLALDTQPYSGGLTTCEALWMGVPVVTFPGKTFAGRHSVSHLTNAGYEQFIAADLPSFVELAVRWASRLDDLAMIRSEMRERVRQSALCDAPRFARDLLTVLQRAWESRAAGKPIAKELAN